ncbi:MAG TPA: hypothetical protein VIN69_06285 [Candidatus Limnocylindria bacterium]|jgi:hypothetical protein
MRLFPRILATSVAFLFVAASCGSSTGEGPGASAPLQTQAAASKALILQGDTVRSPEGLTDEQKTYLSCVEQSRFPQSSRIVWRFKAIDPVSGQALDDKAIKSFVVTLPDGTTADFKYGGHGGTKPNYLDYFWTAGFSIPATYPTGAFTYKVTATSTTGLVGTWSSDQFKVAAAQLTVVPAGKP